MYTPLKNYQIIISLLKQNNIKHLVLSAGTRNIPFVQSVENDPYFKCYSVVDERSAAYMALGMSLRLNEPVVISCTSSTATCNYFPAIAEAYHQGGQLIVLTSDRNPALLDQREDQMINQVNMYGTFVKKAVNLPIINTEEDFWHCQRLVNEAILATHHHGKGPVQINIPMLTYSTICSEKNCLTAKKINRIGIEDKLYWDDKVKELATKKRIMVICGQNNYVSPLLNELLTKFCKKFHAVLIAEYMANIECEEAINPFLPFDGHVLSHESFKKYTPDLVIGLGTNVMSGIKEQLRQQANTFEHWGIEPSGEIIDMYKSLTTIFECSPEYFFNYFLSQTISIKEENTAYQDLIKQYVSNIKLCDVPFSNNTAIRDFIKHIPNNSILHLSINNSIRLVNYYGLPNRTIKVYANIGTHGIDGCLSSYIGQAITSNKLSFLIIGDLSFFYDMGAMRIRHIPPTARILMINNFGGGEFHYSTTLQRDPTMDLHTSAAHQTKAESWVKSVGFKYFGVHNEKEYQVALTNFMDKNIQQPIFIEVFSDMEIDATGTHTLEYNNFQETTKETIKRKLKETIINTIGNSSVSRIKSIIK